VGDEDYRHPQFPLQFAQQQQYWICTVASSGRGSSASSKGRPAGQRQAIIAHAASTRHFVRIAGEAAFAEGICTAPEVPGRAPGAGLVDPLVPEDRLGDLPPDCVDRVEASIGSWKSSRSAGAQFATGSRRARRIRAGDADAPGEACLAQRQ